MESSTGKIYSVTIVQHFDNCQIDTQLFTDRDLAASLCEGAIGGLCSLFPEVDFNVVRPECPTACGYYTVINDQDKSKWLVVKITRHQSRDGK